MFALEFLMPTTTLPAAESTEMTAVAVDEFAELEVRIETVAQALRQAREERDAAQAETSRLETSLEKLRQAQELAERELMALRQERGEIRKRVARLVTQVEAAVS